MSVDKRTSDQCFYLDGPGGSGKTYLYNALLKSIEARNAIALPFATTGLAALLMKGGRTVHSGFKVNIPTNNFDI